MWFYRDPKKSPHTAAKAAVKIPGAAKPPVKADLVPVVAGIMSGRPKDPDALLAMSLLVDSRVEMADGSVLDGLSWLEAERLLSEACGKGEPLRLYNRFSRECGDGYSLRSDLPPEHASKIEELRLALIAANGVRSVSARTLRKSMIWEPSAQPVDNVPAPDAEG